MTTDEMLQSIQQRLSKYGDGIAAAYLQGSRASNNEQLDSDLDLTIILRHDKWQQHVLNDVRDHQRDLTAVIDVTVGSPQSFAMPGAAFSALRVLHSGKLVWGEDVRQLIKEPSREAYVQAVMESAGRGIAMLRGIEAGQLPAPLGFPDPTRPFLGYEIIRRARWYPEGATEGTKELVATATWCATAWLAVGGHPYVFSKSEAVERYAEIRGGSQPVPMLFGLCREQWRYQLPVNASDRATLRSLCEAFLSIEKETLALDSQQPA